MPVHQPLSDAMNDGFLQLLLPCSAGEVEAVEKAVKMEQPIPSPLLAPAVDVEVEVKEQPQELTVAAVDEEDSNFSHEVEEELSEHVYINILDLRKEVQCPICLGIIKKTRTVMECLHRFCRQCIDKSMRMGNNECPACRTHCASRRSLRDDPRYDDFISVLFPDIEKYEAEELAFCEEEQTRNQQIQASIAEICKLQSEILGKKRSSRKGTGIHSPSRSQRNNRYTPSRRSKRRRMGKSVLEESDDNDELENNEGQNSSYSGEHLTEIDHYRHKTRRQIGTSYPHSPETSSDMENKLYQKRSHPGIMWNMEMRAWGKGGARSNIRHGGADGLIRNGSPSTHLAKLVDFLQNMEKMDDEYVASKTPSGAGKELTAVAEPSGSSYIEGTENKGSLTEVVDQFQDTLQMSEDKKPLVGFAEANCISHGGKLILACQQKESL